MQDDIENVPAIITYLREWRSYWPHDFEEDEVLDALAALVEDGSVEVYDEPSDSAELELVDSPRADKVSLRRYWFRPSPLGRRLWKEWDAPSAPE